MIPLNDYQKKLYEILKNNIKNASVFDDVPHDTKLPVVVLGDYVLSEGLTKMTGYSIKQNIDVFSEYEGKKEINKLVSEVISATSIIFNTDINNNWSVISIRLLESPINRLDDVYIANLKFEIELEGGN